MFVSFESVWGYYAPILKLIYELFGLITLSFDGYLLAYYLSGVVARSMVMGETAPNASTFSRLPHLLILLLMLLEVLLSFESVPGGGR